MRGLALVGLVMAACSMDNPLFVPVNTHDSTTTGSEPTSDPSPASSGAASAT